MAEGREEKYVPDLYWMNVEEQAGVTMAITKLGERRFTNLMKEIEEVKERGSCDKED